jgi:hypothetical protein
VHHRVKHGYKITGAFALLFMFVPDDGRLKRLANGALNMVAMLARRSETLRETVNNGGCIHTNFTIAAFIFQATRRILAFRGTKSRILGNNIPSAAETMVKYLWKFIDKSKPTTAIEVTAFLLYHNFLDGIGDEKIVNSILKFLSADLMANIQRIIGSDGASLGKFGHKLYRGGKKITIRRAALVAIAKIFQKSTNEELPNTIPPHCRKFLEKCGPLFHGEDDSIDSATGSDRADSDSIDGDEDPI